jgi:hypothetical protein
MVVNLAQPGKIFVNDYRWYWLAMLAAISINMIGPLSLFAMVEEAEE